MEKNENLPEELDELQEEISEDTPDALDEDDAASEYNDSAAQFADMEEALAEANDKYLRLYAEYDNYRKRTAKEKTENFALGKMQAVTTLLPVLDTLEFALNAPCQDESYKKGIEMVMNQAMNAFNAMGVEKIEAVGKEFDPNFHAAVMQEASEEFESGFVTKELQKGYKMGDKVIRP